MKGPFPIRFWQLFGFHDGRGFAFPAPVPRSRTELLDCGRWVMECLQPELEKIEFDYFYKIIKENREASAFEPGFRLLKNGKVISGGGRHRPGFIEFEIWNGKTSMEGVEKIDLRGMKEFLLDDGFSLKIGKRHKGFPFGKSFPALLKFLEEIDLEEVLVWNRHR